MGASRGGGALLAIALSAAGCEALEARSIVGPFGGVLFGPGERTARVPPRGERLEVRTDDGVELRGFLLLPRAEAVRGLMVFFHGAGDDSTRWFAGAQEAARSGFAAVAWDARGHGDSGGRCTYGARERRDLGRVLDALAARGLPVGRTVLFGYSMGAGVAIASATVEPRVRAVVAVAPFARLEDAIRRVVWAAPRAGQDRAIAAAERAARFQVAAVRAVDDAARLRVPLLVVAGADDRIAPPPDAVAIARAAGDRARLLLLDGADHQDILERCGPSCDAALADLLEQARLDTR